MQSNDFSLIFKAGHEYDGCFEHELKCFIDDIPIFMRVPVIFSFQTDYTTNNTTKIAKINPPVLEELIENKQIVFISKKNSGKKYAAMIERNAKGIYMHIKATIVDKRKDFRYRFCPFVSGTFELRKDNMLLSGNALLESLSSSGLSSLLKDSDRDALKGGIFTLLQGKKMFNIKTVKIENKKDMHVLRAKIISSNVDLFRYSTALYRETFKHVIIDLQRKAQQNRYANEERNI